MAMMEKEIAELMPKTKQLKDICNLMGRDFLAFDCSFQVLASPSHRALPFLLRLCACPLATHRS